MKQIITILSIFAAGFVQAGNLKDISISIKPAVSCFGSNCDLNKQIRVVMRGSNPVQVTKIRLNDSCDIEESPYGYVGVWGNFSMGKSIPIPEYTSCGQTLKVQVFTSGGNYSFMLPN